MANISLDGFLNTKEKRLVDLDWLDISPEECKNVPFDNTPEYIAVPKLEQAWNHTEDKSNFNLVPNSEVNFNYNNLDPSKLNNQRIKDFDKFLLFIKKQMMSGKKGSELVSLIQEKATPEMLKQGKEVLVKMAQEHGLLGFVYIDPTVFSKCEEGAEFVRKRAKTAKYVVSMSKCSGCVYNKDGRCEVYKKHLASEINYDSKLFDFYNKHFENLNGKNLNITNKSQLKNAFIVTEEKETRVAEYMPKISKGKDEEKTLKDKEQEYQKNLEGLQDALSKISQNKIAHEIANFLMRGYDPKTIDENLKTKYSSSHLVENEKAISNVLSKQGSLGKVYLDASLLPIKICGNSKEATEYFNKYSKDIKYILSNCSCYTCTCRSIPSKNIVASLNQIPSSVWMDAFNKYPYNITSKLSYIFDKNPIKALRLAHIQLNTEKNSLKPSQVVEDFNLKGNVDTNDYVSSDKKEYHITPKNISAALEKGFTLTKIVKTGKSLGSKENDIVENIKKALELHVGSVFQYQLDINLPLPANLKIKRSGKDMSIDLNKPLINLEKMAHDSSNSPKDTMIFDYDLKSSNLDTDISSKKYGEIEIGELDQFDIE